ncbi:heme exporter protein CcmD [Pelomonas sp. BJYL3]|uniref:heme exporter protein CcmD n=1 Tax=Pelomonas sp. BJYL3 TaxID=2976697 RepID=UPI0022B43111|nr:heme exporter protein CcmD [Pelomonas sp. BJYL3]
MSWHLLVTPFWRDWQDFLAMGGQGRFVWTSFGLTLAVLLLELALQRAQRRRWPGDRP